MGGLNSLRARARSGHVRTKLQRGVVENRSTHHITLFAPVRGSTPGGSSSARRSRRILSMPGPDSIVFLILRVSVGRHLRCPVGNYSFTNMYCTTKLFSCSAPFGSGASNVLPFACTNHTDREGTYMVIGPLRAMVGSQHRNQEGIRTTGGVYLNMRTRISLYIFLSLSLKAATLPTRVRYSHPSPPDTCPVPSTTCFRGTAARKKSGRVAEQRRNLGNFRRPLPPQGRPADGGQGGERW